MWRPRASGKLVSLAVKVQRGHMAVEISVVVAGGQYIGSKKLAGIFESKAWKPKAEALGQLWAQKTGI